MNFDNNRNTTAKNKKEHKPEKLRQTEATKYKTVVKTRFVRCLRKQVNANVGSERQFFSPIAKKREPLAHFLLVVSICRIFHDLFDTNLF